MLRWLNQKDARGVEIDGTVNFLLNAIKNYSFSKNKILLAAKLNNYTHYQLCDISFIHNCSSNPNQYLLLHHCFLIFDVCLVTKSAQDANFSKYKGNYPAFTVILAVHATISRPILIRASQQFYLPNQLFSCRSQTLLNQNRVLYILIYLLRPHIIILLNFLI